MQAAKLRAGGILAAAAAPCENGAPPKGVDAEEK